MALSVYVLAVLVVVLAAAALAVATVVVALVVETMVSVMVVVGFSFEALAITELWVSVPMAPVLDVSATVLHWESAQPVQA